MSDEADAAVDNHIWGMFDRALRAVEHDVRATELPAGQRALELTPRPEDQR